MEPNRIQFMKHIQVQLSVGLAIATVHGVILLHISRDIMDQFTFLAMLITQGKLLLAMRRK